MSPLPLPTAVDDPAFADALAGRVYVRWDHAPALGEDGLELAVPSMAADGTIVRIVLRSA